MKIAFISQYFFPEQFSNNEIAKALVEAGHQVDVVCCVPNYPAGEFFDGYSNRTRRSESWKGVSIFRAWTARRGTRAYQLMLNYLVFPFTASWTLLRKTTSDHDVSFVSMPSPVTQALAGILLKFLRKTPLVYWVQDIWPESAVHSLGLKSPLVVKPLTWFCGWIYRRADLILVQSEAFPAMIERFNIPKDRIRVFPNTAPTQYCPVAAKDAPEQAKLVPQSGFRLMFAGNIGESQDFDTYLAAADQLRDLGELNWVIVGSGRDMNRVQARVAKLGLGDVFTFLGRHPESSMPGFFAHADAMLVGLKDNDIFRLTVPYKTQCYLACGKPIIASLNGEGARIIMNSGAGLVADAQTPDQLAANIRQMVSMTVKERAQYGKNALEFYQHRYQSEKIYADLNTWLLQAANQDN